MGYPVELSTRRKAIAGAILGALLMCDASTCMAADQAQPAKAAWASPQQFRVPVTVKAGDSVGGRTPVSAEFDFATLLGDGRRVDRNSIRVVGYDPATGQPKPYDAAAKSVEVPHKLGLDFNWNDAGRIWWRVASKNEQRFHVYFDARDAKEPAVLPDASRRPGLIGIGDTVLFNNGKPGRLDVSMSATSRMVDWDNDGKLDLLVGSSQTHEVGVSPKRGYVYFFRNVGEKGAPLFAPGVHLRHSEGDFVGTLQGKYVYMELADADGDGVLDIVIGHQQQLYLVRNTGKRDRDGLPILSPAQPWVKLHQGNDFAPKYNYRDFRFIDWDEDGDLDIIYSVYNQTKDETVKSTDTIIFWDEVLEYFEVHERIGTEPSASKTPVFAKPKVIRTARSIPLFAYGYGGVEFADIDGDGKRDLLVPDLHNNPSGASQIVWYQNIGSRGQPKLMLPLPLIPRTEGFAHCPFLDFVDWHGDGVKNDLMLAGFEGWLKVYPDIKADHNVTPSAKDRGAWVPQLEAKLTGGEQTRSAVADWDGDGLLDIVQGTGEGWVWLYKNIGTEADPSYEEPEVLTAAGQPVRMINGPRDCPQGPSEPNGGYTAPVVADVDGDGDLDLIVGDMRGYQSYFENVATRTKPQLAAGRFIVADGNPRKFGWRNQLTVGDIDGDGKMNIISTGFTDRHVHKYAIAPDQSDKSQLRVIDEGPLLTDADKPLLPEHAGGNNNGDYMGKLVDWDGDGDIDLVLGSLHNVWYYENVGTRTAPKLKPHGKIPFQGEPLNVSGHAGSVDAVDMSGDGRPDLIIAGESGWTYYFERSFLEGKIPTTELGALETKGASAAQ